MQYKYRLRGREKIFPPFALIREIEKKKKKKAYSFYFSLRAYVWLNDKKKNKNKYLKKGVFHIIMLHNESCNIV